MGKPSLLLNGTGGAYTPRRACYFDLKRFPMLTTMNIQIEPMICRHFRHQPKAAGCAGNVRERVKR